MNRADFLSKIKDLAGAALMMPTFGLLTETGDVFDTSGAMETKIIRKSTIYFPANKKFNEFQQDLSSWLDVPVWKAYLEQQKLEKKFSNFTRQIFDDRVEYTYEFRSRRHHDEFVAKAVALCVNGSDNKEVLGYRTETVVFNRYTS